jgi:hypothetical protein
MELKNSFELLTIDDEDSIVEKVPSNYSEGYSSDIESYDRESYDSETNEDNLDYVRLSRNKLSDDMLYLLDSYKSLSQLRCECCDEPEMTKSFITYIETEYFGKNISLSKEILYDRDLLTKYFSSDKLLLLKPYTGQKKIIFFCGCGEQQNLLDGYYQEHTHEGYFSVDVDLNMVPHAIGYVGTCSFSFIPSGTINEILFEGGQAKPTELLEREVLRLLCEGGVLIDGTAALEEEKVLAVKENGKLVFNQFHEDLYDYCTYNPNLDYEEEQDNDSQRDDQTNPTSCGDDVG